MPHHPAARRPPASPSLHDDAPFEVPAADLPDGCYSAMPAAASRPNHLSSARQSLRSVSSPAAAQSVPNGARSIPVLSTSSSRPPVKNLVHKFNQASPTSSPASARARTDAASASPAASVSSLEPLCENDAAQPTRDPKHREQAKIVNGSPIARRDRPSHAPSRSSNSVSSSHSRPDGPRRPLLFGELPPDFTGFVHSRRGSEGAMFAHARSRAASETLPLFFANPLTLDTTTPERTASAHSHRRARSELSAAPFSRQASMDCINQPDQISPASFRNPNSRIPRAVPNRRTSTTSDSASSIQSSRTSSALSDRKTGPTSPTLERKATSRSQLKKENAPRNRPYTPPATTPRARPCTPPTTLSSQRYRGSTGKIASVGPEVSVQVKVPPPTTSPPLRSSRPRQPVSIASTSASRAKVNERLLAASPATNGTRAEKPQGRALPQKPKPKRDLGLAGISIAARKAQIEESLRSQGISASRAGSRSNSTTGSRDESPMGSRQDEPAPDAVEGGHAEADATRARGLTLEVTDLPAARHEEPLTGATEFESDESPILGALAQPRHQLEVAGPPPDAAPPAPPAASSDSDAADAADGANGADDADEGDDGEDLDDGDGNVLSQVLRLRQSRSSSASRTTFADDDKESISIVLDQPRPSHGPEDRWSDSSDPKIDFLHDDARRHFESLNTRDSVAPDDSISIALGTRRAEPAAQDWTPSIHYTPADARLTLDSDAYAVIQEVLDDYHNAEHVTPDMAQESQRRVEAVSPNLSRHDTMWTSKERTEQFLADLMREGSSMTSLSPEDTPKQSDQRLLRPNPLEEYEQSLSPEGEYGGIAIIYGQTEVYGKPSRQNGESGPEDENRPVPPPKDWRYSPRPTTPLHSQAEPATPVEPTSRLTSPFQPNLPEITTAGEGLGLSIPSTPHGESRLRIHPPAPAESAPRAPPNAVPSPPSPGVYSRNPPPSGVPPAPARTAPGSLEMKRSETAGSSAPHSLASKSQEALRAAPEELSDETRKRLTHRRHVARELLDTETAYYQDIKVVEDIYKGTSHSVSDITDDDRRILFGNCEDIVEFSMRFTDSLKPAVSAIYKLPKNQRWDSKRGSFSTSVSAPADQPNGGGMGPVSDSSDRCTFVGVGGREYMSEMERVYSYYAQNHDAANTLLIELQQKPQVQQWLKECLTYAGDITSAWSLDALIVKPTQRFLKYAMLLGELIKATPEDHPDHAPLIHAQEEIRALCDRINESKGRKDMVEKIAGRGRKTSDSKSLAAPFSKAFGRKLKQQIGFSEVVEDPEYDAISQKFGGHFFQLQIVMRDVEKYVEDVHVLMDQNNSLAVELDGWLDISQGSAPEIESKWRNYAIIIRQIMQVSLSEHRNEIRKSVVQPIMTLWKYHEKPQKLMNKRKKRLPEYSKYRGAKECGAKPDKKTEEVAVEFEAINASLKEDLPKLYAKTKTLIETCQKNLVCSQYTWYKACYDKLQPVIDELQAEQTLSGGLDDVVGRFQSDYRSVEAELERIEIVMHSLKEMATFSPAVTYSTEDFSMKRPSTFASSKRTQSVNSDQSVVIVNTPDPSQRTSASFPALPELGSNSLTVDPGPQSPPLGRTRAGSALSSRGPSTPRSLSAHATGVSYFPQRPATAAGRFTEPATTFGRLSLDTPEHGRSAHSSYMAQGPGAQNRTSSAFSSALPMRLSDSPTDAREEYGEQTENDYEVMFLAASLFEFNIAHDRREAGFPYLVYVPGEIFDVIGQKGELWLARNQDDATRTIGWIWEKHFARILPED